MALASARPTTAFAYREITLQDRLREVAREIGEKPALRMGDRSVTFREIERLSDQLAAALARRLAAEPDLGWSARIGMDELAALPHTSGTTGFPEGVMLPHANLTANQQQFFAAVPVRRDDVFLNVLPYFHTYALNLLMTGAISLGATQVIMPRFDMVEYCTLVERRRATVC